MVAPDGKEQELRKALWRPPEPEPQVARKRGSVLLVLSAAMLSLFLPGTGQLLNRAWGRAGIVFAIWVVGWLFHISPVWTIICLYAGIEAGITAARGRPVTS